MGGHHKADNMNGDNIEAKAPGVIKLFGEHAAVYGKLSVAVAISMYAKVSVRKRKDMNLKIILANFSDFTSILDKRTLSLVYKKYKGRKDIGEYISSVSGIDKRILPFATIAARLIGEFGIDILGNEITISSEIPMQSGGASSAACSTAFTVALLKLSEKTPEDSTVLDIARDGERIAHISEGAGRIDTATSYYGGYVSTAEGGRHEDVKTSMGIVLINTGSKKSTAETVGSVRKQYEENREKTEKILNEIEKCSIKGLEALKKSDLPEVGRLMYEDQMLLKELGVSSDGLDRAVEVCMRNGAYGAKLSGGGGGGMAIAIHKNPKMLVNAAEAEGFASYLAEVAFEGASYYLKK